MQQKVKWSLYKIGSSINNFLGLHWKSLTLNRIQRSFIKISWSKIRCFNVWRWHMLHGITVTHLSDKFHFFGSSVQFSFPTTTDYWLPQQTGIAQCYPKLKWLFRLSIFLSSMRLGLNTFIGEKVLINF